MIPHDFYELNDIEMTISSHFQMRFGGRKFSKILGVKNQTNQPHSSAQDRLEKLDEIKF